MRQKVEHRARRGDRQLHKQLVHRLRQKVEQQPNEPQYILTVSGIGCILQPTVRQSNVKSPPRGKKETDQRRSWLKDRTWATVHVSQSSKTNRC